ncbi:MAG: TonB-dependent receptor [Steroidobacteraceae bacterium]
MYTRNSLSFATALALSLASLSAVRAQEQEPVPDSAPAAAETETQARTEGGQSEALETVEIEGKFLETSAQSAMKMEVPVMDTPFSVQSYGKAFIESVEATDISQMFSYMTGVKKAGFTGFDISFRGFKSTGDDQNSLLVDGMPGMAGRYGSPPTVALERIELVRGAMSVLYGQNQPGGFINMVTKKPKRERATSVGIRGTGYAGHDISLGGRAGYLIDLDTTGSIDDDGRFLYRIIGEFGDRDTFRDYTYDKGKYIAPALTWNVGDSTSLSARAEYRYSDSSFDQGLVAPNRDIRLVAPITTYYSEPGNNREEEGVTTNLSLLHTFGNGTTWNTTWRRVDYDSDQREFSHVRLLSDGRTLVRRARHLKTARKYDNFDSSLAFDFTTGPLAYKMTVGVSGGNGQVDENRLKFFNSTCPGVYCFNIDIYDPIHGQVPAFDDIPANNPATPNLLTNNRLKTENLAFYTAALITLSERWKLSVGLRNLREEQKIINRRDPTSAPVVKKSRKSALPMAGLLFQPNEHWTLYGSYSESYVPADPDDQDINGANPFDPLTGEQYEVGVKVEDLFEGRVGGSLALYRIDELNVKNSFSCPLGVCYDQLGEARSEGVEIEANLNPTDRLQVAFGYAYTDARVVASNIAVQVDAQLANAPKQTANIWTSYSITDAFTASVGVSHIGKYQGLVPTAAAPQLMPMPGYTLADIALTYKVDRYTINLKMGNIFDKTHYEATGLTAPIQVIPGPPRNVTLSFRATF